MSPTIQLPAGLVDENGEFFINQHELYLLNDRSVIDYTHFPAQLKATIRAEMLRQPAKIEAYRKQMGLTDEADLMRQFISCNYGGFDQVPDMIDGSLQAPEYWPCPQRGKCPIEGVGCCSLQTDTGEHLTRREIEILQLIGKGCLDKEIADALAIANNTVTSHNKNIRLKTGLSRKADLTRFAIQKNLI